MAYGTTFPLTSTRCGSDVVRMWFGTWFGRFRTWFDVVRSVFGRVFGSGSDSLEEVKGKWFPAGSYDIWHKDSLKQ